MNSNFSELFFFLMNNLLLYSMMHSTLLLLSFYHPQSYLFVLDFFDRLLFFVASNSEIQL